MTHAWRAAPAVLGALAALLASGCATAQPSMGPVPPPAAPAPATGGPSLPAPSLAAPLPQQPLTPLAPGQQPPARSETRPPLRAVNIVVQGDPARVVYPSETLAAGKRYPVVVFFHGSGMDQTQLTERTTIADRAAQEGWLSASAMLTGRTHWADDGALVATGNLIRALVDEHQADPSRIYLVGFSMGGGTALLAAANPLALPYRAAAVVSTQGFTDLAAMTWSEAGGGAYARAIADAYGGELDAAEARAHSPLTQAERLRGIPVYLEHGEADTAVPASHARRMAEALATLAMPPTLRLYPGKGHSEDTIDEAAIIAFLRGKAAP